MSLRVFVAGRIVLPAVLVASVASAQRPASLDTVTVVTSRTHMSSLARSVDVITREEIAASSAHNLSELLSSVMGIDVDTRSAAQADVSIRGSSPEQVVVLVDGVRMTDVQSAHYTFDVALPLESIERIEVMRGMGSALYGPDAVGGVINIVTRRTQNAQLRVRSGSFGTVGGGAADGVSRGAFSLSASGDFDKSDGHRDGTDYRIGQGRLSLTAPTPGGIVRTNIAYGERDFGANDFYGPYDSFERTETTTLDSRWDETAGAWNVALSGSTRRHHDDYVLVRDDPSLYENLHQSWQTTGDLVASRAAGPVVVALGTEGAHDQLSSMRLGAHRDWRAAAFGEATVGDASSAMADLGLRGDHSSVYGDFFSPSVSASAPISPNLHVHASGGAGFRAPTWTERFYTDPANQGNPNLQPERFSTGDVGARADAGAWSFDVTGFARRATNLIDWVKPADAPATALWQTMNVGVATYRGFESSLDLPSIDGARVSLFADGLSLTSSQGAALVGKYALRPITRQAGARLTTPSRHAITARVDLELARRAMESGYVTGNARLAWNRGEYRVALDVLNLTNAAWLDASGLPVARRGVYGGVQWAM
jgi:outer membrane cobalamin receptor